MSPHNQLIGLVVVAALTSPAAAQVRTTCNTLGQQTDCTSTGSQGPDPHYGELHILTPDQARRNTYETELARVRAERAQAELDAYRAAQDDLRALSAAISARSEALAAKVLRCRETHPGASSDADYKACMAQDAPP
jgi:hypothetical protein